VQLFGIGGHLIDRYRIMSTKYFAEVRALILKRYLASFGWGSLSIVTTSATYLYVALQAVAGKLTIGDLGLYTRAAASVQDDFQNILSGFSSLYEDGLYISTLFELLNIEPAIVAPANPVPFPRPILHGIEFRNVTFGYPGRDKPALSNVSFHVRPGETIAVVGPNGAGKTTLVKLLGRLYDPIEGQVLIDGIDVREFDPNELRREIGAIFQDYVTYQFSAGENIGLGHVDKLDDKDAISSAAHQGGAESVIEKLPDGYDTVLGKWFEGGHQLSGGEWQKIALSRAFMRDAQVLILDEPTASLDALAEWDLFVRIRKLTQGRTAIFISHRFSTVRTADRIFVLQHGRLVEQGAHEELVNGNGLYADLFEKQAASYR
jgi:ATP-binding cassette subfamily B protein